MCTKDMIVQWWKAIIERKLQEKENDKNMMKSSNFYHAVMFHLQKPYGISQSTKYMDSCVVYYSAVHLPREQYAYYQAR